MCCFSDGHESRTFRRRRRDWAAFSISASGTTAAAQRGWKSVRCSGKKGSSGSSPPMHSGRSPPVELKRECPRLRRSSIGSVTGAQSLSNRATMRFSARAQVPLQRQQLLYNGKEMKNFEKLSGLGVKDEDLIMMVSAGASSAPTNNLSFNPDGSAVNPEAFQQHIRRDSNTMAQLFQSDPELAQAIVGNDLNNLQQILRERHRQRSVLQRQQEEEMALLYADPFDVEAQKKIEAAIRQKGIDENWAAALEHNPEAFARVVMLYVDMEVNGVPLKAFVDSGAQSTIISKSCAEKCGLLRLLDQRYKGIARGVGQSEILGRIHVAPIKIGSIFYPCSFLVLDSPNMDFLFGLDMLRKHQENVLRVGGGEVSVPFLQEKDIPPSLFDEERLSKEASSSGAPVASSPTENSRNATAARATAGNVGGAAQGPEFEAKVAKLVELGFQREAVIQALKLFDGNEEQAAGFLFG